MKRIALIVVVLAAAGGGVYWKFFGGAPAAVATGGAGGPPGGGPGGKPQGMPVEAEPVKVAPLAHEIIAVGTLRSEESVTLSSEIAGRITGIHFREGQPVRAGALLFELDSSVHRAEVEQARASLTLSERNHERALELFERKLISARERDEAAAKLELDRASLQLAAARLAKTRIEAPFAGIVGLRRVSPGDYITAGQALAPLESLTMLKADFRLAEASLPRVAVGQALNIEVDAYAGETFAGKVYAIDPRLSEETRSVAVRARVPNADGRLRPGLFARVRLVISKRDDAILVPEQAILPQGEQLFVYVIEDGKADLRPVTVGLRKQGRVEVLSGLKAGDVVITAGAQKIGPGAPVMAINLAPPPAPPAEDAPPPAAEEKKG